MALEKVRKRRKPLSGRDCGKSSGKSNPTTAVPSRTLDQLRQHYEVERELAAILRNSTREERRHLYASLYDELFRRVPLHPQLTQIASAEATARTTARQMRFLRRFLRRETTYLEIGPGDCALAIEVALYVRQVYAVDVSEEVTRRAVYPPNFDLILSDRTNIPIPAGCADVAYSDQLMEHLHPDDALEQLEHIYRALSPGGLYICVTPNRISGPHDVSMYFDAVATGFHMKEYTVTELSALFARVGFSHVRPYIGCAGHYVPIPLPLIRANERLLKLILPAIPRTMRQNRFIAVALRVLLNIRLVATK